MTGTASGSSLSGGSLEAGGPIHGHHAHAVPPDLRPVREPGLEDLLGASFDHVQEACGTSLCANRKSDR